MADGVDGGTVHVDVVPDGSRFAARLQAQVGPQADRVGRDIGKQIAQQIAASIRDGIGDGFRGSPGSGPARTGGRRTAEEFGGEFDRVVRGKIQAALRSLPPVRIGVAATEAEQKLRDLRLDMERLSGQRIGVDIDAAEAMAKVDQIRAELRELGSQSPDVQVRIDSLRALAQLTSIREEIDRIDGRNVDVDIDASRSVSSLSSLVTAGFALGPAIIPAAAAGAAAIAGIGAAAAAAATGIGVAALGFMGVAAAVKALGQVEAAASQAAATGATRQLAMAGATNQVASARAAAANTAANAASAAVRSAAQVASADRSLATAVQDLSGAEAEELRIQQTINAAREEAARSLEDLTNQVKDTALAQRRSAMTLAQAEADLAEAKASGNAKAIDAAQLAFDEATQQNAELALQQRRLTAEQAAAQKAGIDGSKQVLAVQDQIVQAKDRVQQAEEQVRQAELHAAEARTSQAEQARQAAFSIAQAQQGIVSAQRAVGAATVAAGTAGGAAMFALQQAMADMSPAGQSFARFIYGLKPVFIDLRKTAESAMLPGLQTGIQSMLPYVAGLKSLIADVGSTIGDIGVETARSLAAPVWRDFFGFIKSEASPALRLIVAGARDVAVGIAGIVVAFKPAADSFNTSLLGMAGNFARWGASLRTNQQFQEFAAYVVDRTPKVIAAVEAVAVAVLHISKAIAPIGDVSLGIIGGLSSVIASIPIPVLTTLGGAVVAVVVAMKAWAAWTTITDLATKAKTAFLPVAAAATRIYSSAIEGAAGKSTLMAQNLGALRGGVSAAGTAVSGLAGVFGGPFGIAVAAATVGLGLYMAQTQKAKAATEAAKTSMSSYADAVRSGSATSVESLLRQNGQLRELVSITRSAGITQDTLNRGMLGDASARKSVVDVLNYQIAAQRAANKASTESDDAASKSEINARADRRRKIEELLRIKSAFEKTNTEQAKSNILIDQGTAAEGKQNAATKALADAVQVLNDKTATAEDRSKALKAAWDAMYQPAIDQTEAVEAQTKSTADLTTAMQTNGTQFDLNKARNGEQRTAILATRDALEQALLATKDEYLANVAAGMSIADATRLHGEHVAAIINEIPHVQRNSQAVQDLVNTYGQIPGEKETKVTLTGADAVLKQLRDMQVAQRALERGISTEAARQELFSSGATGEHSGPGRAMGGPIHGPGSTTSDSIAAWLSNDEHVWSAAEVAGAGGHQSVAMLRKLALTGGIMHHFATGGPVRNAPWPITLDAKAFMADWFKNFNGPGIDSPSVAKTQTFLRAQAGKPYVWAAAGPGGYDCSGLVSAAWNIMHGLKPYRHTFSTATEAKYFPLRGMGTFTAGWAGPGERGGGRVGHTAGNIAGLGFESTGSGGVRVGGRTTPVTSFAHYGHFDTGGYLPPGLTLAYNGTGAPERIRTAAQEAALTRTGGDEIHFHGTGAGIPEVQAWMDRRDTLARLGRPR